MYRLSNLPAKTSLNKLLEMAKQLRNVVRDYLELKQELALNVSGPLPV